MRENPSQTSRPDSRPDPRPDSQREARRARVVDIARSAQVSTATVDRVLNRRPGVRDATVQRVLKAAGDGGGRHLRGPRNVDHARTPRIGRR